jgi:hypothetical protein
MTNRRAATSPNTIATFCEHTAEMLEGATDATELNKRHGKSLIRLRDALAQIFHNAESDP